MTDQVIEDPVLKQRYSFRRTAPDVLLLEAWVDPGGGVTPHVHPSQEERFTILEGECTFTVGHKKVVKHAGETAVIPRGTRHAYRNSGNDEPTCARRLRVGGKSWMHGISLRNRQRDRSPVRGATDAT